MCLLLDIGVETTAEVLVRDLPSALLSDVSRSTRLQPRYCKRRAFVSASSALLVWHWEYFPVSLPASIETRFIDLMVLGESGTNPHALSNDSFDGLFGTDTPW